jgi:hypothetical protein
MNWKEIELKGAGSIARVCAVYELSDNRLPAGGFKIKVLERENDYIALPNIRFRLESGVIDGTCGLGRSEIEALQDAFECVMAELGTKDEWLEEELEWSDPSDF